MPTLPPWLFPISRAIAAASIRGLVRTAGSVVGVPTPVLAGTQRVLNFLQPGRPGAYPFLSDEWFEQARAIRESYRGRDMIPPPSARVNYTVTDAPLEDGSVHIHTDSTGGEIEFERGHLDDAHVTVTLPYEAARALLVEADVNTAMQYLSSGRIRVEGDLSKLFALTTGQLDPVALEVAERIRRITA